VASDNREYNCCSHYYHVYKLIIAGASKEAEEAYKLTSGEEIYNYTKKAETAYYNAPNWKIWESRKDEIMKTATRLKFEQNPGLMEKLLITGDKLLIDDHPTDTYW
jgi:ribA/ribD-fused uncharacterized protein